MLLPVAERSVESDAVLEAVFDELFGDTSAELGEQFPSVELVAEKTGSSVETARLSLERLARAGLAAGDNVDCRTAGLEMLPKLVFRGSRHDFRVLGDVYASCRLIWPILAGLCAERCAPEVAAGLHRLVDRMDATEDLRERHWLILQMSNWLVDNSGSPVFQLLANNILSVLTPLVEVGTQVIASALRSTDRYRELAEAVVSGDPQCAQDAARRCWDRIWDSGIEFCAGMVRPHD
ncbi:FCD domain-containing protein [Pseudonocardiaceae bacterium YIM PH 21723]|nr:FCD domain-containing protein [Pseudonocardiaceae bacterium YIM PH 21723]